MQKFKFQSQTGRAIALLGLAVLSSCASILNDSTQQINVTSSNGKPFNGNIDGVNFSGPGMITLKRAKSGKVINVSTPSCNKQTNVPSEVDTKFWINILSGGVFGSTTDYSTDKMWKYQDNVTINCH